MTLAALAAALLAWVPSSHQDPPAPADPVALEDVLVTGVTLERLIGDFVDHVAEPNRGRGLARWERQVCVGVANLKRETAQYLVDRISTVAEDIGLSASPPGCTPNLLIVATSDSGELAANLVDERTRAFRIGGSGTDRGGSALRDFVATQRPIRWWQVSMPIDSETGERATRLPGECRDSCQAPSDYAPVVQVFAASRLRTQIIDNIFRTIVIVDVDEVTGLSALQLADYIAMVSLAQIDPEADTQKYASILNVFQNPTGSTGLTDWDQAYLSGLYAAERNLINRRAGRREIADSILDAHQELRKTDAASAD